MVFSAMAYLGLYNNLSDKTLSAIFEWHFIYIGIHNYALKCFYCIRKYSLLTSCFVHHYIFIYVGTYVGM
jgi:hypothetical protein